MSGYPHKKVKRLTLRGPFRFVKHSPVSSFKFFVNFWDMFHGKSKMQPDFVDLFRVFEVLVRSEQEILCRRWEWWCGKFLRTFAVPFLDFLPYFVSRNQLQFYFYISGYKLFLHHGRTESKCNYLWNDRLYFLFRCCRLIKPL